MNVKAKKEAIEKELLADSSIHILERYSSWQASDTKYTEVYVNEGTVLYKLLELCDFYESRDEEFELEETLMENWWAVLDDDDFGLSSDEIDTIFEIIKTKNAHAFDELDEKVKTYCTALMENVIEENAHSFIATM